MNAPLHPPPRLIIDEAADAGPVFVPVVAFGTCFSQQHRLKLNVFYTKRAFQACNVAVTVLKCGHGKS